MEDSSNGYDEVLGEKGLLQQAVKEIFYKTNHKAHYDMMMAENLEDITNERN